MSKICPSSPINLATNILGILGSDGLIRFLPFKAGAALSRDEPVTRYTTKCIASKCSHWLSGRCEWTERLAAVQGADVSHLTANCNIRPECRWYFQVGLDACRYCPLIHENTCLLEP